MNLKKIEMTAHGTKKVSLQLQNQAVTILLLHQYSLQQKNAAAVHCTWPWEQ